MKLDTSSAGFGLCVLGALLILSHVLTGRGDVAQIFLVSGGMITGGVGLLKAANDNEAVKKHELPNYGEPGKSLSKEIVKSEDAANGKP